MASISRKNRTTFILLSVLLTVNVALASSNDYSSKKSSSAGRQSSLHPRADFPLLRLLPVGDSITAGVGTSDGNSYRLALRNSLLAAGYQVDFIGSNTAGTNNPDNQHEGFGGYRISSIQDSMTNDGIMNQNPNIVLVHAGTNDNDFENPGEPYSQAPQRLGKLIDFILCHDAEAVVLVAKLIQNNYNQTQTDLFNRQVPTVVNQRASQGFKVRVVDMSSIGGNLLSDALHPNADGYKRMAQIWMAAIQSLPATWVDEPEAGTGTGTTVQVCQRQKTYWTAALGGKSIAAGAHVDGDPGESGSSGNGNTFTPQWEDRKIVLLGAGRAGTGVRFADLDGDGREDYLWIDPNDSSVRAWLNKGEASLVVVNNAEPIAKGSVPSADVAFADLTGDGKDDLIIFGSDGKMNVFRNGGASGNSWQWLPVTVPNPVGRYVSGSKILFGDMNGNGKADMAVIQDSGSIDYYIQQGEIGTSSFSWRACPNQGLTSGNQYIKLRDIDGDGRADFVVIDSDGGASGFLNKPGGSCGFSWVAVGGTKGVFLSGATSKPELVRVNDYDGDGKADYMFIDEKNGAVQLWTNKGINHAATGASLGGYGAGVRLADLDGDGVDDYFSVGPSSEALAYINGGVTSSGWSWYRQGGNGLVASGTGAKRQQVIFADLNGDGRDDYLVIGDETGSITCWLNGGPFGGGWSWIPKGIILLGLGRDGGVGVRFADMTGDGRADYIYLDAKGAATVWTNDGFGDDVGKWSPMNNGYVAALGVGADRADVRFADIDGDGRADYLWVHPENGATDLWYNDGPLGNALGWISAGQIASGVGTRGLAIQFARIGTSGRADYVAIEESTGALRAWLNGCSAVSGTRAGNGDKSVSKPDNSGVCEKPPLPPTSTSQPSPVSSRQPSPVSSRPPVSTPSTSPNSITFYWEGCNNVQKSAITEVYNYVIQIAKDIRGKLATGKVLTDFMGAKSRLSSQQLAALNDIIAQLSTYDTGYFGWVLIFHCNDFLRRGAIQCPSGTKKEDRAKCGSRCWRAVLDQQGNVVRWKTNALAYTTQAGGYDGFRTLGHINICPGWYDLRRHQILFDKWRRYSNIEKYRLDNYISRESSLMHELFHIDELGKHSGYKHVFDRGIRIYTGGNQAVKVKAYGPLYTKALARWHADVGAYTLTNADSLALYYLACWIREIGGFYPDEPHTDKYPIDTPDTGTQVFNPFRTDGSRVYFDDYSDVAMTLQVPLGDVNLTYTLGNPAVDCWDLTWAADENGDLTVPVCNSNAPLDLNGSLDPVKTLDAEPPHTD